MEVLSGIEPASVFKYFEEICAVPHGSGNTKQISDYCADFAREHNFQYFQDEFSNIIIVKEASAGYENHETVILQGHLDMVCEKSANADIDMRVEGLRLAVNGDFVYAEETTLGGDDGIAVAMALAILADRSLVHPRLEVVFTVDEEIGMLGAARLDASVLHGKKMINIDSEDEGVFTVSCAGGNVSKCILPVTRSEYCGDGFMLEISGLIGGHSGVEIDKGRANANILLGRMLCRINAVCDTRIVSVNGGLKDNAIANESCAYLYAGNAEKARAEFEKAYAEIKNEYQLTDKNLKMSFSQQEIEAAAMDEKSTEKTICMLTCLPNGIEEMSMDIRGLVQTSLNMGILASDDDTVSASFCVRSSIESQKNMLTDRLGCLMKQLGGRIEISGDYPGWEYDRNSQLQKLMTEVFCEQYGYEPKVEAIHAGVECGLFAGKLSGLDCISIGPDLTEIHTFREKMSISSVQRVWKFILEVLKRL